MGNCPPNATLAMGQILGRFFAERKEYLRLASSYDFEAACQMLQDHPQLVTCRPFVSQKSILHYAAGMGKVGVLQHAKIAVDSMGGDATSWLKLLDDKSRKGYTPFLTACKAGKMDCVLFLMEAGANVFAKENGKNMSALHLAARGHPDVIQHFVAESTQIFANGEWQVLRSIRCTDNTGQCQWINNRADRGLTALHIAVMHQSLECVLLLLEAGASIFTLTILEEADFAPMELISGSSSLHIAARRGNLAIIQALLQAQADFMRNMPAGATGSNRINWEGDPEWDLRSMQNDLRQIPYQVALRRNNWGVAQLLHPNVPIAIALDNARSTNEGLGARRLSVLCGIAHSTVLLQWLERYKQSEESDIGIDTICTIKDGYVRNIFDPPLIRYLVVRPSVHLLCARNLPYSSCQILTLSPHD